jgi:hypothetical protein
MAIRTLIFILISTTLYWMIGAYIELDSLWFMHIGRPEDRGAIIILYLSIIGTVAGFALSY